VVTWPMECDAGRLLIDDIAAYRCRRQCYCEGSELSFGMSQ